MSEISPAIVTLTRDSNRELASILSTHAPHRRALPQELILQILSHPTRWILTWSDKTADDVVTRVSSSEGSRMLLHTPPLTASSVRLLRKVVFTIRSHDQGWSSFPEDRGTFENTWTWFDAVVASKSAESVQTETARGDSNNPVAGNQGHVSELLDSPNNRRHGIQANKHAVSEAETYTISISRGDKIFEELKAGDQILLIACARYSGWVNTIEAAGIEVWEEDDLNDWAPVGGEENNHEAVGTKIEEEDDRVNGPAFAAS